MISYFNNGSNNNFNYGHKIFKYLDLNFIDNKICTFKSYTKLKMGKWLVFVKHSENNGIFKPTHEHQDFGCFVIYYDSNNIIVDKGRKNYLKPYFMDEYCSSLTHNSLTINGLPLMINSNDYFFSSRYKKSNFIKKFKIENGNIQFCLESKCVKRIGSNQFTNYKRVFSLNKNSLEIYDCVTGEKDYTTNCSFNFDPELNIEYLNNNNNNNFKIYKDDLKIILTSNYLHGIIKESLFSKNYSSEKKNNEIVFEKKTNGMLRNSFIFTNQSN